MLKLKLQSFGHLMQGANSLQKTLMLERLKTKGKGMTEDEMIGWHHCLNGHKFEQTLGGSEEQCSPVCCSPWGHKESDTSYRLTEQQQILLLSNLLNCYFLFKHYYYSSDTNIYWHKFLFQNCFTSL